MLRFELRATATQEQWVRHFPGRTMRSILVPGGSSGLVAERLGPLTLVFAPKVEDGALRLRLHGMRCWGCPLPRWWWPRIEAVEQGEGDRLWFRIEAWLPVVGCVAAYHGHLVIPGEMP